MKKESRVFPSRFSNKMHPFSGRKLLRKKNLAFIVYKFLATLEMNYLHPAAGAFPLAELRQTACVQPQPASHRPDLSQIPLFPSVAQQRFSQQPLGIPCGEVAWRCPWTHSAGEGSASPGGAIVVLMSAFCLEIRSGSEGGR